MNCYGGMFILLASTLLVSGGCRAAGSGHLTPEAPFIGFALDGYPITAERVSGLADATGRVPDLLMFYLQWPSLDSRTVAGFPAKSVEAIRDAGAMPCITWEPMYIENGREKTIPAATITNGNYDAYIRNFAQQAADWGKPVLVRFAHEMNISRYHWGTSETDYGPESPEIYKELFRYVVTLCRDAGNTNILWVFCPNAESVPVPSEESGTTWNAMRNYYPGGAYVDVLGLDGYNWGTSRNQKEHGWTSRPQMFKAIFEIPARELMGIAPRKPLFVFETASVGTASDKEKWLRGAFRACSDLGIYGIVWFQVDKETDWTLPVDVRNGLRDLTSSNNGDIHEWIKGVQK